MGVCETGISCCPDWIITLAIIGGAIIYALIGLLIFTIVKSFKEDLEWDFVILFVFVWPVIIAAAVVGAIVYYFAKLIAMPIIGADKYDLRKLKDKMDYKIESEIDHLEYKYKPLNVKKTKPSKKKKAKK